MKAVAATKGTEPNEHRILGGGTPVASTFYPPNPNSPPTIRPCPSTYDRPHSAPPRFTLAMTIDLASEDATQALAAQLARTLAPGDCIALQGGLGAGKTTFVRHLAAAMNIDPDTVSSPTFVIINEYQPRRPGTPKLIHIDAYRLSGDEELDTIGWYEAIASARAGEAIIAIEWPSRIAREIAKLPSLATLALEPTGEFSRRATLTLPPGRTLASSQAPDPAPAAQTATAAERCRTCGRAATPGTTFCSERCQLADLHKWLTGQYVVSRELKEDDLQDPDSHQHP